MFGGEWGWYEIAVNNLTDRAPFNTACSHTSTQQHCVVLVEVLAWC